MIIYRREDSQTYRGGGLQSTYPESTYKMFGIPSFTQDSEATLQGAERYALAVGEREISVDHLARTLLDPATDC